MNEQTKTTETAIAGSYKLAAEFNIQLPINKTNTKLISQNSTVCYVLGIGKTDYTIHKDANDIKQMYFDKTGYFKGFRIVDFHNYHVFKARIKSIAGEIKYKDEFTYKGKKYKINSAYIGVCDRCKLVYHPCANRSIDYLTFDGEDMSTLDEQLKYILSVSEIFCR